MENKKKVNRKGRFLAISLVGAAVTLIPFLIPLFMYQSFWIPTESMLNTLKVNDRLFVDKMVYKAQKPKQGDIVVFHAPDTATSGKALDFIMRCIAIEGDTVEVIPPKIMAGDNELDAIAMTGMDWHRLLREVMTTQEGSVKFTLDGVSIDGGTPMPIDAFQKSLKAKLAEYTKSNGPSLSVSMANQLVEAGKSLKIIPGKTLINGKELNEPYIREDPDYVLPALKIGKDELFVLGDNRNFSHDSHMWGPTTLDTVVGKAKLLYFPSDRMRVFD
jgi:signal peptidase I